MNSEILVIATNNGKKYLTNLLNSLEIIKFNKKIAIIDTQSTQTDSIEFLKGLKLNNEYNLDIEIYKTPYSGYDTGAYIYAMKNFKYEVFYFIQDSMVIKSIDFFEKIKEKLSPGVIVPIVTFCSNFYDNEEEKNFCLNNLGTYNYSKGIFGPMFSITGQDVSLIEDKWFVLPKNKNEQMAMERGWSIIFEKYNFKIIPLEGEHNNDKLYNDKHIYFKKIFPVRP